MTMVCDRESLPFLDMFPVTTRIALDSVKLEPFHADPADRLIVATALATGATLVTKDERIREFGLVPTVW